MERAMNESGGSKLSSRLLQLALLSGVLSLCCEGKYRKFGPAQESSSLGSGPGTSDASPTTPQCLGDASCDSDDPSSPGDETGPQVISGTGQEGNGGTNATCADGGSGCNDPGQGVCGLDPLSRHSCGACDVACSVTEYCAASGCIEPGATLLSLSNASIRDFAFDLIGARYLTGSFEEPVDFGNGPVDPGRAAHIFVAKYSASGVLDWVKNFGPDVLDLSEPLRVTGSSGLSIDLDTLGNVYVTGELRGAVDFGGGLIGDIAENGTEAYTAPGNVFVASYEPNGAFRWATVFRSTLESGVNRGTALAVGERLLYVAGEGVQGLDVGTGTIGNLNNHRYLFLAAFDRSNGSTAWSIGLPYSFANGTESGFLTGLDLDSQERIYLSGWWRGRLDFGAGELTSGTHVLNDAMRFSETGFVASYGPSNGALRWVQVQQDHLLCNTNAVAVDESDNVFAVGWFVRPIDLGGGRRESGDDSGSKMFVVSYDAGGTYRFDHTGRTPGGQGITIPTGVTAHGSRLLVSGYYYGPVDVGGALLTSTPEGGNTNIASSDVVLISYNLRAAAADLRWARHFGTSQLDTSSRVHLDREVAVFGAFVRGALDIDGTLVEPLGDVNSVLIRITE